MTKNIRVMQEKNTETNGSCLIFKLVNFMFSKQVSSKLPRKKCQLKESLYIQQLISYCTDFTVVIRKMFPSKEFLYKIENFIPLVKYFYKPALVLDQNIFFEKK